MHFFWFGGHFGAFGEDESSLLICLWSLYYCGHFLFQDMCKAATESVASSQTALQSELRRNANTGEYRLPVLPITESQRSPDLHGGCSLQLWSHQFLQLPPGWLPTVWAETLHLLLLFGGLTPVPPKSPSPYPTKWLEKAPKQVILKIHGWMYFSAGNFCSKWHHCPYKTLPLCAAVAFVVLNPVSEEWDRRLIGNAAFEEKLSFS